MAMTGGRGERCSRPQVSGHWHRHGATGTDVSKEAANMILVDDDFSAIM